MNREQTQLLKGIAIIMMLFLHLFNSPAKVDLCHNLIFIDGKPLALILSRVASPVSFFLILGGYGMYKVYEKGDRHRWTRVSKLYLHYWIILAIFLSIGVFIRPERYPGSFLMFISNLTTYHTTYNHEMWFLLPYVVVSLLSPLVFKMVKRIPAVIIVAITFFIDLASIYLMSHYGESFFFHNYWAYNPLLVLHMLFNFSLGAMAARSSFFERFRQWMSRLGSSAGIIAWFGIITCVAIDFVFKYNFFFAFMMISLLNVAYIPGFLKKVLCHLGNQSMNMWMIHTWFCVYLFRDFIYAASYPLLILLLLIIVSYVAGLIVDAIVRPIERRVLTRSEMKEKIAI